MDYQALTATDVWEREKIQGSVKPIEVLAVASDTSLLGDVRRELESKCDSFRLHCVASGSEAHRYCQSHSVDCVMLAVSPASSGQLPGMIDLIHQLRIASGILSLPTIILADSSSSGQFVDSLLTGTIDRHDFSEAGVIGLADRVSRLMWQVEIEQKITDNHLHIELLALKAPQQHKTFVAGIETLIQALQKPLDSVQVFTLLALDEPPHPGIDPQNNPLILTKDSSEQLKEQIDELHQVVKRQLMRNPAGGDAYKLRDLLSVVLRVSDIDTRRRNIDLEILNNSKLPALCCDVEKLCKILIRIVSFGSEYIGDGGKLRLGIAAGETENCQKLTIELQTRTDVEPIAFNLVVRNRSASNQRREAEQDVSLTGEFDFAEEYARHNDIELRVVRGLDPKPFPDLNLQNSGAADDGGNA